MTRPMGCERCWVKWVGREAEPCWFCGQTDMLTITPWIGPWANKNSHEEIPA